MNTEQIKLSEEDFGTLAICAIRYCHDRQTYMPDLVRSIIRQHLKDMPNRDIRVMLDDCKYQARFGLYGDEYIDKPGWLMWEKELEEEMDRRRANNDD